MTCLPMLLLGGVLGFIVGGVAVWFYCKKDEPEVTPKGGGGPGEPDDPGP